MATRKANATWEGALPGGSGRYQGESGEIGGPYTFGSRFAEEGGTNPEEMLAAAEAACFSMAFAGNLARAGATPERVHTDAACTIVKQGDGFRITTMKLTVRGTASGVDAEKFREIAEKTKETCPVSMALGGVDISVEATLES